MTDRSPQDLVLSRMLAEADRTVPTLPPRMVLEFLAENPDALLVDVREPDEFVSCHVRRAVNLPRGQIEFHIEEFVPALDSPVLLICRAGARSLLTGKVLQSMGYLHVVCLKGGLAAWVSEGLPTDSGWHA
jgi:rhodanese-related sulfurtransferase